jgi:hypothetical protein
MTSSIIRRIRAHHRDEHQERIALVRARGNEPDYAVAHDLSTAQARPSYRFSDEASRAGPVVARPGALR